MKLLIYGALLWLTFVEPLKVTAQVKSALPAKTKTVKGVFDLSSAVINYPAAANIKHLKRFHLAYNETQHKYDKDYLTRKYYMQVIIPIEIVRYLGYMMEARTVGGKKIKPQPIRNWFRPAIVIKNVNRQTYQRIPINDLMPEIANRFSLLINGAGSYEILFEQTFPSEPEFRKYVRDNFRLTSGERDEVIIQQHVDQKVEAFKDVIGKKTRQPINRFGANYDFLVAALGDSYASGEGNPMACGQDLPENGIFDSFTEIYSDIKTHASNAVGNLMDGNYGDAYKNYLALSTGMAVLEQIVGPCTITTLNMAGMTTPNFDVQPAWIENGGDNMKTSRSYINPTAPASFQLEDKFKGIATTYLNFATSGATAENLYLKKQHSYQEVSQIDELAKNLEGTGREIDALTIAIGANDVEFSGIMAGLIKSELRPLLSKIGGRGFAIALAMISGSSKADIKSAAISELAKLENKFMLLDEKIKSKLKVKKIFLLEYPNAQFSKKVDGRFIIDGGCGVLTQGPIRFTKESAEVVDEIGTLLNEKLKSLAIKHNWTFVEGATEIFKGHGYCMSSTSSYYRAAETSCGCQGNYQGMLHPNYAGFQAIKPLMLRSFESQFSFDDLRMKNTVVSGTNSR